MFKIIEYRMTPIVKFLERFDMFKSSNRAKHCAYAIPAGFFLTILFVFGLALGMEYKDRLNGGVFDIKDIVATIIGGFIGQVLQIVFLMIVF